MDSNSKFNQFIREIKLFEYERTDENRDGQTRYDSNGNIYPLLRYPKYQGNILYSDYYIQLEKLREEVYQEVLDLDNKKIESRIYQLKEITNKFKAFRDFLHKYSYLIKDSDNYYYDSEIMSYLERYTTLPKNGYWEGEFGRITHDFISDLTDALTHKEAPLYGLIFELEKYLAYTMPPPPAEQRGFVLEKETELKSTNHFKKALDEFNIEEIKKNIETHFSELPYDDNPKSSKHSNQKWEGYFRSNLLSYFRGFDIKSKPEEHTRRGRSDLIIERENKIYCFEVKYNGNAQEALKQILETKYLKKYDLEEKQLIAIGLNFSASSHNIEDLKYQILDK